MKFFIVLVFLSISSQIFAQEATSGSRIYIKMGQAKTQKSLLAFPSLLFIGSPGANPEYQTVGAELYRVINNNLTISTYFQFISQTAYLEDPSKTTLRPYPVDANGFKFDAWKQIGAEFLIRGSYTIAGDTVTLETYTYHVPRGELILGKKYRGTTKSARRIAHTFCNELLEALTGKPGMFLSKVTVASNKGLSGFKEIFVMDWDGANLEKVSNHKSIVLSPAWSPDGSKIAYTAFVQRSRTKTRNADMFIYELLTGKRWLVSYRQGLNSGANFLPGGDQLYLTLSQEGNPDIYKMTTDGKLVSRITKGPRGAMNVEPAASPDGKRIAFSSDRSGQPMIYIMNSDGTGIKRITFAGRYNSTPNWSPDGSKLTFAGWENDHFDVFIMNSDGTGLSRITSARKANGKWAQNEDPVFSPDGRFLMYTSNRTGSNQIYMSNLDGSEERRITSDSADYFKPKWSKNFD